MTWTAIRRFFCGLWTGHAFLLVIEKDRFCVECQTCGLKSPGWDVEFSAPPSNVVSFHAPITAIEQRRA